MRSLALSQPEDSCTHIARQCVQILLMLTMELLSRLLSVAPNSMINVFAHFFCSAPEPEARPLSTGIMRETHIHLKHAGVQSRGKYHRTFLDCDMCTAPVYV